MTRRVIDEYKLEEYKEKKGKGFIRLISELQWIRNAELDNGKPYEEKRILWKKRIYFMGLGSSLGLSLHFGMSFMMFTFAVLSSLLSPVFGEVMSILGMVFKLIVLLSFPIYLLKAYHVYDRGITRLLLTYTVLYGYSFVVAMMSFVFFVLSILFYASLFFLSYSSPEVKHYVDLAQQKFPFLFSPFNLLEYPVTIILVVLVPYLYLKKLDRKNRWVKTPYTLLDEVPEG